MLSEKLQKQRENLLLYLCFPEYTISVYKEQIQNLLDLKKSNPNKYINFIREYTNYTFEELEKNLQKCLRYNYDSAEALKELTFCIFYYYFERELDEEYLCGKPYNEIIIYDLIQDHIVQERLYQERNKIC